jgi:hypothetical protein
MPVEVPKPTSFIPELQLKLATEVQVARDSLFQFISTHPQIAKGTVSANITQGNAIWTLNINYDKDGKSIKGIVLRSGIREDDKTETYSVGYLRLHHPSTAEIKATKELDDKLKKQFTPEQFREYKLNEELREIEDNQTYSHSRYISPEDEFEVARMNAERISGSQESATESSGHDPLALLRRAGLVQPDQFTAETVPLLLPGETEPRLIPIIDRVPVDNGLSTLIKLSAKNMTLVLGRFYPNPSKLPILLDESPLQVISQTKSRIVEIFGVPQAA